MPLVITITASVLSGGLAGACVSVISNRLSRRRQLRTKFYPVLNNMYSAYVIRMEKPEGRYWTTIVGNPPATKDNDFVDHRTSFLSHLVEYNELKEARVVRTRLLDNQLSKVFNRGGVAKVDLVPEATALGTCLTTLHKKLGL